MTTNPFDDQKAVAGIKNIIVVGSGKGGVGKSTISVHLACAFSRLGMNTGLLDSDIHGPSLPRLLGCLHQTPQILEDTKKLLPIQRYGLALMSMGFLVPADTAVIWRGPMLFKALNQFLNEVQWGELDVLVIDLPPGTGDIQLTLAQKVPVRGAIIVCTPQNVALSDAIKAIDMFEKVKVPILGVVENMSAFIDGDIQHRLFPKGDLDSFLAKKNLEKLAEVPFYPTLAQASEIGIPVSVSRPDSPESLIFKHLAENICAKISDDSQRR